MGKPGGPGRIRIRHLPANTTGRSGQKIPKRNLTERKNLMKQMGLPSPPEKGMNIPTMSRWLVLWEHLSGKSASHIHRKWGFSRTAVKSIIDTGFTNESIPTNAIKKILNILNFKLAALENRTIDAITPEELERSSLSQKAILIGILSDKTREMDKHLSGTEDMTPNLVLSYSNREELNRRILSLQERIGIEDAEVVEAEPVSDVRINQASVKEKEDEEASQLNLFSEQDPPEEDHRDVSIEDAFIA